MHQFKARSSLPLSFKKLSLVICLVLAFSGCASNSSKREGFSFSAESSPQGIAFHFNNIPPDAVHLSVSLEDKTAGLFHDVLFWDNEAFYFLSSHSAHNDLDDLKQRPFFVFPFTKEGHEYEAVVLVYTDKNLNDWTSFTTRVIAGGGIYLTNSPSLNFTDENQYLTLSEKPVFSEEVMFSPHNFFSYSVMVMLDEANSRGGGGSTNELSFPAHEVYDGSRDFFGFTGTFPVIGSAQANIIHENMEWIIGIARTPEVLISF